MQDLYNSVIKVFSHLIKYYNDAMILCHSWGLNGHKRKYRWMTRHLTNWKLWFQCELMDKYRMPASDAVETMRYSAGSFAEHLSQWDNFLKENINALAEAEKQFINMTGFENCIVKEAVCCLLKDYEKTGRYFRRFEENGWNLVDIHMVDDLLHEKIKAKEESEGVAR